MKSLLALSLAIFSWCYADLGTLNEPLQITIHRKNDDGTNSLIRRLSPALNEATSTSIIGTLWPVSTDGYVYVPYKLDSTALDHGSAFSTPFHDAITEFNTKTNIRLISHTNQVNYVTIKAMNDGCWSDEIGLYKETDIQNVNIEINACNIKGKIVHEFCHVLGLGHTQTREDRDDYVTIHWDNIIPEDIRQFVKRNIATADDCGYYDYGSIMHYGQKYFTSNGLATITAKNPAFQGVMGQRDGLSNEDINCLNYLYVPGTMPVRIIPSWMPGHYVRFWSTGHAWNELVTDVLSEVLSNNLEFLKYSTFKMIDPALSPSFDGVDIYVSFESMEMKGWYIRAPLDGPLKIDFKPPNNSEDFNKECSFILRRALNHQMDYVSFESVKHRGYFIQRDINNNDPLQIKQQLTGSSRNREYLDTVSFKLECTFNHKSQYVDTCPQGKYVIHDLSGSITNALTTSEELKCNRSPLEGLIASNGTKRFKFHNDKVRDVVFTDCESTFDPKLHLFKVDGFKNGPLVTPDNNCDHNDCTLDYYPCHYSDTRETIKYSSLDIGDYYLQIEPYAEGGVYSVKAYCPDGFVTIDGALAIGTYANDNHLEPYIFALKTAAGISKDYIISDCHTAFDPYLIIYNDNFEQFGSDYCDYNGAINDDCIAAGYSCSNTQREIIKIPLQGDKNFFIGIRPYSAGLFHGRSIDIKVEVFTPCLNGGVKELILELKDIKNGYFNSNIKSTGLENDADSSSNTYSIVGKLNPDHYKGPDGKYEFHLLFRGTTKGTNIPSDGVVSLKWKQSRWITESWTWTSSGNYIDGFEELEFIPNQEASGDDRFYGLSISDALECYLDGTGQGSDYYNCVGAILPWDNAIASYNNGISTGQSLWACNHNNAIP